MNEVQLYVDGQRVDLFNDENIVITSSIQNSKDISKIFTDFSQSFTVPASDSNNKIFKHYYNADIGSGYGFDARKKADSTIELNYSNFRNGKLRLDGVQLKQSKPYAYKVTFFGNTVTLPDLLGEDLLSDLAGLDAYDHEYSESEVLTGLQSGLVSGNIVYPLISHSNRLYYDSSDTSSSGGNLYYDVAYAQRGVQYTDLKPALKLSAIIDAIESEYGLTFDSKFIDGTLTGYEDVFPNLFMWLHSKKGEMQTAEGVITRNKIKNFLFSSGTDTIFFDFPDAANMILEPVIIADYKRDYQIDLTITPVQSGDYSIYIYRDNVLLDTILNINGTHTTTAYVIQGNEQTSVYAELETSGGITNYDASWNINTFETSTDPLDAYQTVTNGVYSTLAQSLISTVFIKDNIPNMKVIDFLTNLFRMFNLTAFVKQTGEIYVEPLNTFYEEGDTKDISRYINNEESTVNRAIPYKTMNFEFPESKTFHAEKRNQIFGGIPFGNLVYHQELFDGTSYSLKVDFEKMVYERITNTADNTFTDIGWGWSVDYNGDSAEDIEKASSVVGKPLIFFNVNTTQNTTPISFYGAGHNSVGTYNRPSNVNTAGTQTLNFNAEIDEYALSLNTESLYKRYYETYISQVFDISARMYSYKSKLPNNLLLNYSINDTFIIGDREYVINSIKTDTRTGETKLELINKLF